jgi:DNA-binding FadR family transcriptional regulator
LTMAPAPGRATSAIATRGPVGEPAWVQSESHLPPVSRPRPIRRRRYLEVADKILYSVALGVIAAGQRLPNERELARLCGVSRATVRDALLALELTGVVEVRGGSGCYLTGLGLRSELSTEPAVDVAPRDLLEVRQMVEPGAARLCAERATRPEIEQLGGLLIEAEDFPEDALEEDLDSFVGLNLKFHRDLARAGGNVVVGDVVRHLVDAADHPLWLLADHNTVRDPATRAQQVREHNDILGAVMRRDPDAAAEAMARHLGAVSTRIFGPPLPSPTVRRARRRRK